MGWGWGWGGGGGGGVCVGEGREGGEVVVVARWEGGEGRERGVQCVCVGGGVEGERRGRGWVGLGWCVCCGGDGGGGGADVGVNGCICR